MPNGRKYRFDDADVPEGAVLVKKKKKKTTKKAVDEKTAEKKPNKSKKPANKARKVSTK